MAVDTRATTAVTIAGNSYTLLSASLTDESIQGSGLVRCRGNCEIKGLLTPAVGALVRFTYTTASGTTRNIPRTLRVLSSFANVITRRTQIELGDLLVYLDNRKPGTSTINTRAENGAIHCYVFDKATLPISAAYVVDFCLDQLGLTASSIPLTNRFSDDTYDLSGGYVSAIGELLLSESYVGYLDYSEVLQVRNLTTTLSTGPLLVVGDLIETGPIGTGSLPGEAVVVSYESKQFVPAVTDAGQLWEYEQSLGDTVTIIETVGDTSAEVRYSYQEATFTSTQYDAWDRAIYRWNIVNGYPAQRWTQTWWRYALPAPVEGDGTEDASDCIYDKPEASSDVLDEYTEVSDSRATIAKATNLDPSIYPTIGSIGGPRVAVEKTLITYSKDDATGVTKTDTRVFVPFVQTPIGADVIRKKAALVGTPGFTAAGVVAEAGVLTPYGGNVKIRSERKFGLQERPGQSQRNSSALSRDRGTVNTEAKLEWVYGSALSTAVTEFTLPKVPDDYYTWTLGGGYVLVQSDAQEKALRFGRIQNAMLLGNRQGMSIQCSPLKLPPNPFDSIYIQAGGFTGQYRVNGLSWTINETDVIASVDAMLWGVVGAGSGVDLATSWIPLASGTTTLPTPPASASDGTYGTVLTPTTVAPPYGETVRSVGVIRLYAAEPAEIYPWRVFMETASYAFTFHPMTATVTYAGPMTTVAYTFTYHPMENAVGPMSTLSYVFTYPDMAVSGTGVGLDVLTLSPTAWWDASDSASVTTASGDVSQWNDKSGNGWHVTQSNAGLRPAYTSAAINGKNAVEWPISTNSDALFNTISGVFTVKEIYAVVQYDSLSAFATYEGVLSANDNATNDWITGSSAGTGLFNGSSNTEAYVNGNNTTDRIGNVFSEIASPCILRLVVSSGTLSTSAGVVIGSDRAFASRGWRKYIAEIVVFSTALSPTDRGDLETYLGSKWGVTLVP